MNNFYKRNSLVRLVCFFCFSRPSQVGRLDRFYLDTNAKTHYVCHACKERNFIRSK